MNENEINALFEKAESFAERTYFELFNHKPDTSNEATREMLFKLMQAWLTGYAYLRIDPKLDRTIEAVFGFFVESVY